MRIETKEVKRYHTKCSAWGDESWQGIEAVNPSTCNDYYVSGGQRGVSDPGGDSWRDWRGLAAPWLSWSCGIDLQCYNWIGSVIVERVS
jgi:hypothetical protein